MKRLAMVIAAAALSCTAVDAASAPAATTSPPVGAAGSATNDVRCLIVASIMAGSDKTELQQPGMMAALYFSGKLEGRISTPALESQMKSQMVSVAANMAAEGKRCGAELASVAQRMTVLGQHLQAQESKPNGG